MSWRRDVLASAITCHGSELILHTLAEFPDQLRGQAAIQTQLRDAADAMSQAWPAWRAVARQWDIISTGDHLPAISPVASEFGDLVLRVGRLAYSNPQWTPSAADNGRTRPAAELVTAGGDLRTVLAAVHHATDAVSDVASHDAEAVREAASVRRLYMPTRLLPEHYDIPSQYAPAPPAVAGALLSAYDSAIQADLRAAPVLDDLAVAIDAPSNLLAAARAPNPQTSEHPARTAYHRTGQVAPRGCHRRRGTRPGHARHNERIPTR